MRRFTPISPYRAFLRSLVLAVGFAASTLSVSPTPAVAQVSPPEEILMIGNSLTRGVGRNLKRLFRDDDLRVKIKSRTPSGFLLSDHLTRKPIAAKIAQRDWDIVVLQEQSNGIGLLGYVAARELDTLITANGSSTMFFMTWRKRGQEPSDYDDLRGVPGGDVGYVPIAFELDAPLAPVGWAFREAVVADPNADLWGDATHANKSGRYLAACVFYATILGQSPVGNLWYPRSIGQSAALWLQQLAEDTVLTDPAEWNIDVP